MTALGLVWRLNQYNLNDDGFGNLVVVPAHGWAAAHYFAYSDADI